MAHFTIKLKNQTTGEEKTVVIQGRHSARYAIAKAKVEAGPEFQYVSRDKKNNTRGGGNKPWNNRPRHRTGHPAPKPTRINRNYSHYL